MSAISPTSAACAVVAVRNGERCLGATDAIALAHGRVIEIHIEQFDASSSATALVDSLRDEHMIVLPGSPDCRDLAPHLAVALSATLRSNVVAFDTTTVTAARFGGLSQETFRVDGPTIAVLQHGLGMTSVNENVVATITPQQLDTSVKLLESLPADPATMDLAEAPRIVGAGIGLGTSDAVQALRFLAERLGASVGGTRVITDLGWLPFSRQIGTTGIAVDPRLYINFGVSGAVQHVTGLGQPDHIISVNTDASCPMMAMADLAVVADASGVIVELLKILELGS